MTKDNQGLKSSFDLAMERMAKRGEGIASLTAEQKAALADISAKAKAKIAEVEIMYGKKLAEVRAGGDAEKIAAVEGEMRVEVARIKEREETERRKIR
jgi:hypothetical protein